MPTPSSPYKTTPPASIGSTPALSSPSVSFLHSHEPQVAVNSLRRALGHRNPSSSIATDSDHRCPRSLHRKASQDLKGLSGGVEGIDYGIIYGLGDEEVEMEAEA